MSTSNLELKLQPKFQASAMAQLGPAQPQLVSFSYAKIEKVKNAVTHSI